VFHCLAVVSWVFLGGVSVRPANGIRLMHGHRACKHAVIGLAASIQKSRGLRNFLRGLLLLALLTTPSMFFGQGYFGTVSGEITDPSGALVPHATVTLIDQQKGFQFRAISDSSGRYVFTSIPPGVYSVSAEPQGFEKTVRTGVQLNVSENATANLRCRSPRRSKSFKLSLRGKPSIPKTP
jgi:hypothetical protein